VLLHDTLATLRRVAVGFALVVAVSVPLGIAMGVLPAVRAFLEPIIGLFRYMPAPAFIPLLIIWLGLGEWSKIALLYIGTVFYNTIMTADVAEMVPGELVDAEEGRPLGVDDPIVGPGVGLGLLDGRVGPSLHGSHLRDSSHALGRLPTTPCTSTSPIRLSSSA
jgi:hypothetical protein